MSSRLALAAVVLLAACTPRTAPTVPAGKRIFEGQAVALAPSPDGAHLAWLSACQTAGRGIPGCSLLVAPAEGGAPVRVAEGVTASPGSFAWGPDGSLLALARRDPGTGAGDLVAWRPGTEPRRLASGATSFTAGPGMVAFAAGGEVHVARGPADPVRLAGGVGALEVAMAPGPAPAVAARVRDGAGVSVLVLWRGGTGRGAPVARDVGAFSFSPDGEWLAVVAGVVPGTEGNLVAVPARPGKEAPVVMARAVGPFQWAPGADRLAWLEGFDARGNAGRLASARPGEAPVRFGDRVTAFEIAPGGGQLAYVRHVTQGGYVATLELSPAAAAAAGTVAPDATGFAFSADGRWLLYRAGCSPAGDACALFRVPATGLGPSEAPERLGDGVVAFVLPTGTGDRMLLAFGRRDGAGVDLSAWRSGRLVPLDGNVLPGSPVLLGPLGRRAAWIGAASGRPGVHVADIP
jgi:hypothetical protein